MIEEIETIKSKSTSYCYCCKLSYTVNTLIVIMFLTAKLIDAIEI